MLNVSCVYVCRDIKPENILFDEGILKVADFGLALNVNEENAVTRAGKWHTLSLLELLLCGFSQCLRQALLFAIALRNKPLTMGPGMAYCVQAPCTTWRLKLSRTL